MDEVGKDWLKNFLINFTSHEFSHSDDPDMDPKALLQSLRDELFRHQQPFTVVLIVIYVINFIVGLLGNIFVILVIMRHRHLRTLTNVFFVNLTVGDLMVVCICLPITLGNYIYRDWIYGQVMCKLTPFLQGTALGVSVLSMMSISINRYFAIHKPLRAKILFSRNKVGIMLVLIWVISIAAVIPLLVINGVTSYGVPEIFVARACEEKWGRQEARQFYNLFIFSILFLLPLSIMAALYSRISMALFVDDPNLFEKPTTGLHMANSQATRLLKQRRKTVRSLILLVVLFGVSWLPYYVVNIWLDFQTSAFTAHHVFNFIYPMVQVLGLSNSSVNPLVYCFLSNGFRRAFANLCCRQKRRTHLGILVTVRYRCTVSEDSGVESVQTVLS